MQQLVRVSGNGGHSNNGSHGDESRSAAKVGSVRVVSLSQDNEEVEIGVPLYTNGWLGCGYSMLGCASVITKGPGCQKADFLT